MPFEIGRSEGPPRLGFKGIEVEVPPGWECRIRQAAPPSGTGNALPVLHAATVPLPPDRADYGGGVVESLQDSDVFIALVEFGSESVGTALFSEVVEVPKVKRDMFHPFQLQRRIRGQAGKQIFFTLNNRAFCLYIVIGSFGRRAALATTANDLIRGLKVAAN